MVHLFHTIYIKLIKEKDDFFLGSENSEMINCERVIVQCVVLLIFPVLTNYTQ